MTVTVANRQRAARVNVARLKALARRWAGDFVELSVVLVGDEEMAELNRRYHATAGTTDILTFDYGAGVGELVIGVERAVAQARRYRTTPGREVALYLAHGILHLRGYDDRTPAQRRRMRAAERRLLAEC
jgi:probable rRNA maturation factor